MTQKEVFEDLLKTLEENEKHNTNYITNVKLFCFSWRQEMSDATPEELTDDEIKGLFRISTSSCQDPYMIAKEAHLIEGAIAYRNKIRGLK